MKHEATVFILRLAVGIYDHRGPDLWGGHDVYGWIYAGERAESSEILAAMCCYYTPDYAREAGFDIEALGEYRGLFDALVTTSRTPEEKAGVVEAWGLAAD